MNIEQVNTQNEGFSGTETHTRRLRNVDETRWCSCRQVLCVLADGEQVGGSLFDCCQALTRSVFLPVRAEGAMRTMTVEKLLKGMPTLQSQIDALLDFEVSHILEQIQTVKCCLM